MKQSRLEALILGTHVCRGDCGGLKENGMPLLGVGVVFLEEVCHFGG